MRKIGILIVVLNLMILSSWSGLSILHTVLHKIPNPFHSHSHHDSRYPVYQHKHSAHHGHSHSHLSEEKEHSFKDHVALQKDVEGNAPSTNNTDKTSVKDFFKLKCTFENPIEWFVATKDFEVYNSFIFQSPLSNLESPKGPPPKFS